MDDFRPLSMLTHRKALRVRGPRPCSWISASSDSSLNEYRDIWPWTIQRPSLSQGFNLRSTISTESSDSDVSSPSSSPTNTAKTLVEYGDKPYYRRARRRKPAGPRPPHNSSFFGAQPRLVINTSLHMSPQLPREIPSTTSPVQSAKVFGSPEIPPFTVNSPSNFLLDWDVIFEVLGCSKAFPDT